MPHLVLKRISEAVSAVVRNVVGYVTKDHRKRDRKETQKKVNENL